MKRSMLVAARILVIFTYAVMAFDIALLFWSVVDPSALWTYQLGGVVSFSFIALTFVSAGTMTWASRGDTRTARGKSSLNLGLLLRAPKSAIVTTAILMAAGGALSAIHYVGGFSQRTGEALGDSYFAVDGAGVSEAISRNLYFQLLAAHNVWYPIGAALIFLSISALGLVSVLSLRDKEPRASLE